METLLNIEPQELSFPYELNKQASCSIRLTNGTHKHVAFKVMTTSPKKYCVLPNLGIVLPGSSSDLIVTMTGPQALPPEGQCKDKFLIKSVVASPCATTEDVVRKLFDKEAGTRVQEFKLGVIYTFPIQLPSPAAEESVFSFASGVENTNSSDPKMSPRTPGLPTYAFFSRKLLDIRPLELKFDFELKKELSCLLQLSNMTKDHIFFKVKTTDPNKYCVQPNIGIVLPESTCDVIVRMKAQDKIPPDRQCKDKFLIQSIVGSAAACREEVTPQMFNETGRFVEEFKLGVVYSFPSIPQSPRYEPPEAHSSSEESPLQHSTSNDPEGLDRNGSDLGHVFLKHIVTGLLGLIIWYLLKKLLPYLWSLAIVFLMLVVKMVQNVVSNSVEDWIVKCLGYVCIHFLAIIFGRKANVSIT